jgi:hypothetical protein
MSQDSEDLTARVERLEAWVETAMRTLVGIGLEDILYELDEARGGPLVSGPALRDGVK